MKLRKLLCSHWPIIAIIFVAAILRFWRLEELTTFGGDQGYDFLIVKRILVDGKLTLLGPKIGPYNEIGNLYLGPAYYYLIAPFLLVFNLDPIGPAVLTILLSLATILVIYLICINFFSKSVAILAASLYAFNVFLIDQSRAPSNPHLIPFFAYLVIFSVLKIIQTKPKSKIWPLLIGFSLGILFQLHYLTVSLILAVLLILAMGKNLKKISLTGLAFLVTVSPQILFELRHQFFITGQFLKQIRFGESVATLGRFGDHLQESVFMLSQTFFNIQKSPWPLIVLTIILITIHFLKSKESRGSIIFLALTIIFGLLLASFYSGAMGLHYFASIYASIVILVSLTLVTLFNILPNFLLRTILILVIVQIFAVNFLNLNLDRKEGYTMPAGWNLTGIKKASEIIANDVYPSQKFNIAATLDGDTRARPYRYLVEVKGKSPLGVEDYPNSQILYLISRDEEELIKSYTVWEVVSFKPFEISNFWDIQNGIRVYKLTKLENYQ